VLNRRAGTLVCAAFAASAGVSCAFGHAANSRGTPASAQATPAPASTPAPCPVTHPNGDDPDHGTHGRGSISVFIGSKATFIAADKSYHWPDGTMLAQHLRDGTIYAKLLWTRTRRAYGRFRITGLEVNKPSLHVRPDLDPHLLESPYVPSDIVFPRSGCYRITARAGKGRLRFVIKVEDLTSAAHKSSVSSDSGRLQQTRTRPSDGGSSGSGS
jgi:hypothetical protein